MSVIDIEELVIAYQQDPSYAQRILDKFTPLIIKYISCLKYNDYDIYDYNTIKFLALFIADQNERKRLFTKSSTPHDREHLRRLMYVISREMYKVSKRDLEHDLYIVLLEIATKYKDVGKGFLRYISSTFHFRVYQCIQRYCGEIANGAFSLGMLESDEAVKVIYRGTEYENKTSEIALDAGINSAGWTSGAFAGAPFDILSPQERLLLIKRYIEKRTLKDIAETTGYSISGISKKIEGIKSKINVALKETE